MFELIVEVFQKDGPTLSWAAPQMCVQTGSDAETCTATLYPTRAACEVAAKDMLRWAWAYSAQHRVVVGLHCEEVEPEAGRVS